MGSTCVEWQNGREYDKLFLELQALSQGLYALGKLKHRPGDATLQTLCLMLPAKVTTSKVDRQAVAISMWAMAVLGFRPGSLLFKQLMQLVMIHCAHFHHFHYSQARLGTAGTGMAPFLMFH